MTIVRVTAQHLGKVGVRKLLLELAKDGVIEYATEVTIEFIIEGRKVRIRVDAAWWDEQGNLMIAEAKNSKRPTFTRNQQIVYSALESAGPNGLQGEIRTDKFRNFSRPRTKGAVVRVMFEGVYDALKEQWTRGSSLTK